MKRLMAIGAMLAAMAGPLGAQEAATAASEREQAEERIMKRIEGLDEAVAALQKNIMSLREEVRHARDELDRFKTKNEGAATQDNIKRLAEKIEEVDKKRQSDNEKVVKYIDARFAELQKLVLERPSAGAVSRNPGGAPSASGNEKPRSPSPGPTEKGFEYKIKSGDRLPKIVAALKAQGFKATEKQIMDANPTVDWSKLKIDQKIFIPDSR